MQRAALGITVVSCTTVALTTTWLFVLYSREATERQRAKAQRIENLKKGGEMSAVQALSAGRAAMAKGLLTQAISVFSKGIMAKGPAEGVSRTALLNERAAAYLSLQQYDLAVKDGQESTTLEPTVAHGWMLLGYSQLYAKNMPEAEKAYEQALALGSGEEKLQLYGTTRKGYYSTPKAIELKEAITARLKELAQPVDE